ncbi:hypothetical protein SKAU_G00054510 [Synaphobranchus kaupii]|uniref:Uncharacterized protein n=1 Tax=Synaphobranchus kaupii TaxID=118154 RepID=A0A9Q1G4J3_SYNKA|nr:hypothetical protein SKAU_G00054510 [Synaphobranchus kaupii]
MVLSNSREGGRGAPCSRQPSPGPRRVRRERHGPAAERRRAEPLSRVRADPCPFRSGHSAARRQGDGTSANLRDTERDGPGRVAPPLSN